jgi:hypothetical protein
MLDWYDSESDKLTRFYIPGDQRLQVDHFSSSMIARGPGRRANNQSRDWGPVKDMFKLINQ